MLVGRQGDDLIDGQRGGDFVDYTAVTGVRVNLGSGRASGEGRDRLARIEGLFGSPGADRLTGNAADNWFFGLSGNDWISAAEGNDFLHGGRDTDDLDGGLGIDECRNGENLINNCEFPPPDPTVREMSRAAQIVGHIQHRIDATPHR